MRNNFKTYRGILILSVFIASLFLFGFVLNIPSASAIPCTRNETCLTPDGCAGIRYCTNGQYGDCVKDDLTCGGKVVKCGDKICNGTETCSTCPSDCGICGGGGDCTPSCVDKYCGENDGCNKPCPGKCEDKTKVCNILTYKCVKPDGCKDSDATAYDPYYVKGETIGKDGKKYTDKCIKDLYSEPNSNEVSEYVCTYDGKVGGSRYICPFGCKDGVCQGCKDDNYCPKKGEVCNTKTHLCEPGCTDSDKTPDYPDGKNPYKKGVTIDRKGTKQTDFCNGNKKIYEFFCNVNGLLGEENIDCKFNCSQGACNKCGTDNECPQGFWCNRNNNCEKNDAHNCCIGYVKPMGTPQNRYYDFNDEICSTFKDKKQCNSYKDKGELRCWWGIAGYPSTEQCLPGASYSKVFQDIVDGGTSRCEAWAILPTYTDTKAQSEKFFQRHLCGEKRFFIYYHTTSKYCSAYFGFFSECMKCSAGKCTLYEGFHDGCSVGGNPGSVDAESKELQKELLDAKDYKTKIVLNMNQMVSTLCSPTTVTVTITAKSITKKYFSCDKIEQYNEKKSSGCAAAEQVGQAQFEKATCTASDKKDYMVMCCPTPDDPGWKLAYVNPDNPQCPSPSAFNNLFRNVASLLKPVGDALNNTVVIATSAISAAAIGVWWLVSKIFLKK